MATYFIFIYLFFCYLFYFTMEQQVPKTGKFYKAPSIIEKVFDPNILPGKGNYLVRGMRTFWFEHGTKLIRQMTHEVFIDADAKYIRAINIKKKYEHSITFQLGATAASIMDNFEDMLVIYRRYANLSTIKTARQLELKYDLKSYNEALLSIEGLYYMIRVEEHIFNNAVERLQIKLARIRRQREKKGGSLLRSKDNQQNTLRTRDNQQNTLRTRDNQQNILRTREAQQNILQTRDNQQNNDRGSEDNSVRLMRPEQNSKGFDATQGARHNKARSRSKKKPLWVYKEAKEDINY